MRRLFATLVIGVSALSTSPARAELEQFSDWESRAYSCGYAYQQMLGTGSVQYAVPEMYPFKDAFLIEAKRRGASPEQLQALDKEFEESRARALDEGWVETEILRDVLESWDESSKQRYRDTLVGFFALCTMNDAEAAE